jgi:hypothetical protein
MTTKKIVQICAPIFGIGTDKNGFLSHLIGLSIAI